MLNKNSFNFIKAVSNIIIKPPERRWIDICDLNEDALDYFNAFGPRVIKRDGFISILIKI